MIAAKKVMEQKKAKEIEAKKKQATDNRKKAEQKRK